MRAAFRRTLSTTVTNKVPLAWLDLRGAGFSALERLVLEEALLRLDSERCWILVGTHPAPQASDQHVNVNERIPEYIQRRQEAPEAPPSGHPTIVLGIGGKPDKLLHTQQVHDDGIWTLRRFSGGGTVIVDDDSLWTTVIGRTQHINVEAFPRPLMEWTANRLFAPVFERLASLQHERQSTTSLAPQFALREHDYVLDGHYKMGGNAQSIVKTGWLHHTSFLWSFGPNNMAYLQLPEKRPDYRKDRPHGDFLQRLSDSYPNLTKSDFFNALQATCRHEFDLQPVSIDEALRLVADSTGSLQAWFDQHSRTRIVQEF